MQVMEGLLVARTRATKINLRVIRKHQTLTVRKAVKRDNKHSGNYGLPIGKFRRDDIVQDIGPILARKQLIVRINNHISR